MIPTQGEAVRALKEFGRHKDTCAMSRGRHFYGVWLCEGESCTCGLSALLAVWEAQLPQQEESEPCLESQTLNWCLTHHCYATTCRRIERAATKTAAQGD